VRISRAFRTELLQKTTPTINAPKVRLHAAGNIYKTSAPAASGERRPEGNLQSECSDLLSLNADYSSRAAFGFLVVVVVSGTRPPDLTYVQLV
jgi:hypothetical protein